MIGAALSRLGALGPTALPFGLALGLLVPPLADLARPLFAPSIFAMLVLSMMRVDPGDLAARLRAPLRLALAPAWLLAVTPMLAAGALAALPPLSGELAGAMVLYAASPPVLASVAYAAMLRLDVSLALLAMVSATLLSPIVLPPLVLALIGLELDIAAEALMLRLALLIGGAFAVAMALRRAMGAAAVRRRRQAFDGLIVIVMTVFALSIMEGVAARLLAEPMHVLAVAGAAFGLNLALQASGLATLAFLPRGSAVTLAMMTGHRNMGILMAALGAAADPEVFLYFVLAQIPIYTLPALLRRVYARIAGPPADAAA
jgi:BASS family bile acid:Na+ symporter